LKRREANNISHKRENIQSSNRKEEKGREEDTIQEKRQ